MAASLTVLLTRIWSALLALLATALLAAVFLIPLGLGGDFTEAERGAIRGVTDGGLVAFEADIASSPVSLAPALLNDSRIRTALEATNLPEVEGTPPKAPPPEDGADANDLSSQLIIVANEELLNQHPLMSVALAGPEGEIVATTGLDERLFPDVAALGAFKQATDMPDGDLFSAALGGKLYAVKISRKLEGHRLVALEPLDLGGTSFLRRVLGSNPAGLVRDGELLGEPIGGATTEDLVALVTENADSLPPEGASQAVTVGTGPGARIGAIGRVPGPAGRGDNATIFAVLSQDTLSTKQADGMAAIQDALDAGKANEVPWPIVLGVGVLGLAVALWLPGFEGVAPQRRLANEFQGLASGSQKQIFHDAYGGVTGQVARNAAAAHEALRGQVAEEIMAADEEDGEDRPRRRPITRSTRSLRSVGGRRGTRRNKAIKEPIASDDGEGNDHPPDAIELPDAPADSAIESHSQAAPEQDASAPAAAKRSSASPPAPTFSDEVSPDDSLMGALGSDLGGTSRPPAAPPSRAAEPPPRPAAPPPRAAEPEEDPREAYFREIFEEFVSTKQACGENVDGFTYEKFARKLRKNTADLMKRPGTKDVQFSVYVKDGKAALKAKVVKE